MGLGPPEEKPTKFSPRGGCRGGPGRRPRSSTHQRKARWRTGSGVGGPCQGLGLRHAGTAGRGRTPALRPHSPTVPCFAATGSRLRAASSLRLLGKRATSGVPSNQAPPRDPRSVAFCPAQSAPPADRSKARKGWAGEGPRQARRIPALVQPREWGRGGGTLGGGGKKVQGICARANLSTRWNSCERNSGNCSPASKCSVLGIHST